MNKNKIIIGILLVILGLLFLVDQTGLFNFWGVNLWRMVWLLWPLILVAIGVKLILQKNTTGGIILTSIGAIFLLSNFTTISFWGMLWPLIIIAIGISILFKDNENDEIHIGEGKRVKGEGSKEDYLNQTAVFGGFEKKVISKDFKGGEVNAIFGAAKLDLRDIEVKKEGVKLEVNAIFGGVEVLAPKKCKVITTGSGAFGGWNSMIEDNKVGSPTIEITGSAVFGGVEIR